jgi:antibiotic biosynthesis monooxygenase (ABM) superfamily enzyme
MIARIWHGWTKPEDAKAYEKMLHDEIFPSIAARKIEGYRGAELFVREDGDEVEFVTLLLRFTGFGGGICWSRG